MSLNSCPKHCTMSSIYMCHVPYKIVYVIMASQLRQEPIKILSPVCGQSSMLCFQLGVVTTKMFNMTSIESWCAIFACYMSLYLQKLQSNELGV